MSATQFNQERLLQILLAPQVSEKATMLAERNNQVVFMVVPDATKPEIKAAVEMLFKVRVKSVQVANAKGKAKRFGRSMGRRSDVRKAFVSLEQGQEINFAEGVA
jgi:large subunit ribosomal protein L23